MLLKFLTRYMEETTEGGEGAAPVVAPAPVNLPTPEPAKPEPAKPEPAKPGSVDDKPYDYPATGNPNVDYALGIIGKAGISNEHPAALAAAEGDFTLLKHVLAAKNVAGADHLVAMLEKAAADDAEEDQKVSDSIANDVYELAGGQEQWSAVQAWGAANASPEEKETLNEMFANPKMHKIAANYLINQYNAAGNVKTDAAPAARQDVPARTSSTGNEPLTRVQFAAESAKLRATHGDNYVNTPEYQALGRRLQR